MPVVSVGSGRCSRGPSPSPGQPAPRAQGLDARSSPSPGYPSLHAGHLGRQVRAIPIHLRGTRLHSSVGRESYPAAAVLGILLRRDQGARQNRFVGEYSRNREENFLFTLWIDSGRRLLLNVRRDLASARVEDFARARLLCIVGGIAHQLLSWHVTSVAEGRTTDHSCSKEHADAFHHSTSLGCVRG